jgi:hypothetical protein
MKKRNIPGTPNSSQSDTISLNASYYKLKNLETLSNVSDIKAKA